MPAQVEQQKLPIPKMMTKVALAAMKRSVRKRATFDIDKVCVCARVRARTRTHMHVHVHVCVCWQTIGWGMSRDNTPVQSCMCMPCTPLCPPTHAVTHSPYAGVTP